MMSASHAIKNLRDKLKVSERMPVVFLGHGNPMNAIEQTPFGDSWTELGAALPRPQAILVISAHWMTQGETLVDVSAKPRIIYDFYGFPKALSDVQYPAHGHPVLAREVVALLSEHHAVEDDGWGLDHGAWMVLKYLYPDADVPVFQLSLDLSRDLAWHMNTGAALAELRDRGVLILGSGNIVHNLKALRVDGATHDWALEFDGLFADRLADRDFDALADKSRLGALLHVAHPSIEHYLPALPILGAADARDSLTVATTGIDMGAVSMRSFLFHNTE